MITTRFAPSPTGHLHVGNMRTALFNWLFARQNGGRFILRLDDTDMDRSTPAFADGIQRDLDWLGLHWDVLERQSHREERHRMAVGQLKAAGILYDCYDTPAELDAARLARKAGGLPPVYDRSALTLSARQRARLAAERDPHWRFRLDGQRTAWEDLCLGPMGVDTDCLSDPVLVRQDGTPLYTLASVADDVDLGVTHVIRGGDHVTNTAVHIQIARALSGRTPSYGHVPLMTGPGGAALSKRLGSLSIKDMREAGITPGAILGMLFTLGSARNPAPVSSVEGLIEDFDLEAYGASPLAFDPELLSGLTRQDLRGRDYGEVRDTLSSMGVSGPDAERFWTAVRGSLDVMEDAATWWDICQNGAVPLVDDADRDFVCVALSLLPDDTAQDGAWGEWTGAVKVATGRKGKALFMPLRRALTGRDTGPEMAGLLPLLRSIPEPRGLALPSPG